MKNLRGNRNRFIIHGFFYSNAISSAAPSTILPLIINYFSSSSLLIGVFSSLLRGGAVLMQLYAAFHAQSYERVIQKMRYVFIFRFLAWFMIGLSLYFFSSTNPTLTLWLIGIGLFLFSFSAGFGTIYFQELMGKCFTKEYRGKTLAYRQLFSGIGAILSGFTSAWFLKTFDKPMSFAYLFLASAVIMSFGYLALGTINEDAKKDVAIKEKNFGLFLNNSRQLLRFDKVLQLQITLMLIYYSNLFILPFLVLNIKGNINIADSGILLSVQMFGAMLSNLVWARMSGKNLNKEIVQIAFLLMITALIIAFITKSFIWYSILFFLIGASMDGFKIAFSNLILILSSEEKRPMYVAVQNNISSLGLFFSIPGGFLVGAIGFYPLLSGVIGTLIIGLFLSFKLKGTYQIN